MMIRFTAICGALLLCFSSAQAQNLTGDNLDLTNQMTAAGDKHVFGSDGSNVPQPFNGFNTFGNHMIFMHQPTALSGGANGPVSGFVFTNNQTQAAKNVAQLMWVNEAIADGTNPSNDKRIAQINVITGNSPNSGQMHFRTFGGGVTRQALVINENGNVTFGQGSTTTNVHISGDVSSRVVEIRGGSDLSESFEISDAQKGVQVEPGSVVCIDPAVPGNLRISDKAYDSTVAGIVSGAGGLNTGLLMGQEGSIADGQFPVALSGRVYCLVETSAGAIRPGDLLTTSDVKGHARKVTDHQKATGSIIGKAMTSLEEGEQGLVMVLVNLH
jgi:hypothetical protein